MTDKEHVGTPLVPVGVPSSHMSLGLTTPDQVRHRLKPYTQAAAEGVTPPHPFPSSAQKSSARTRFTGPKTVERELFQRRYTRRKDTEKKRRHGFGKPPLPVTRDDSVLVFEYDKTMPRPPLAEPSAKVEESPQIGTPFFTPQDKEKTNSDVAIEGMSRVERLSLRENKMENVPSRPHCIVYAKEFDNRAVFVGGDRGQLWAYHALSSELKKKYRVPIGNEQIRKEAITAICVCGRKILCCGTAGGNVFFFDTESNTSRIVEERHKARVNSIVFIPHEGVVWTASSDCTINIYELKTGIRKMVLHQHGNEVRCLSYVVGGIYCFSGGADQSIICWDVSSRMPVRELQGHEGPVVSLVQTGFGNKLWSASHDGKIKVWNTVSFECEKRCIGHGTNEAAKRGFNEVLCLAVHGEMETVWSGGADQQIFVWDESSMNNVAAIKCEVCVMDICSVEKNHVWSLESGTDERDRKRHHIHKFQTRFDVNMEYVVASNIAVEQERRQLLDTIDSKDDYIKRMSAEMKEMMVPEKESCDIGLFVSEEELGLLPKEDALKTIIQKSFADVATPREDLSAERIKCKNLEQELSRIGRLYDDACTKGTLLLEQNSTLLKETDYLSTTTSEKVIAERNKKDEYKKKCAVLEAELEELKSRSASLDQSLSYESKEREELLAQMRLLKEEKDVWGDRTKEVLEKLEKLESVTKELGSQQGEMVELQSAKNEIVDEVSNLKKRGNELLGRQAMDEREIQRLRQENSYLSGELAELKERRQEEIDSLRSNTEEAVSSLKMENERLFKSTRDVGRGLNDIREGYKEVAMEKEKEIDALRALCKQLETSRDETVERDRQLNDSVGTLANVSEKLEGERTALEIENKKLIEKIIFLEKSLMGLDSSSQEQDHEKKMLKMKHSEMLQEAEILKTKLDNERNLREKLEQEFDAVKKDGEALVVEERVRNTKLMEDMNTIKEELSRYRFQEQERVKDVSVANEKVEELKERERELTSKLDQLTMKCVEGDSTAVDISKIAKKVDSLSSTLEAEFLNISQIVTDNKCDLQELGEFVKTRHEKESEKQVPSETSISMNDMIELKNVIHNELNVIKGSMNSLQDVVERNVDGEMKEVKVKYEQSLSEKNEMEKKIVADEAEIKSVVRERTTLEEELSKVKENCESLQIEMISLEQKFGYVEKESKLMAGKHEKLIQENDSLGNDLKMMEQVATDWQRKYEDIMSEKKQLEDKVEETEFEVKTKLKEKSSVDDMMRSCKEESENLKKRYEEVMNEKRNLEAKVANASGKEYEKLLWEKEVLEHKLRSKEEESDNLSGKYDRIVQDKGVLEERVVNVQTEVKRTEGQLTKILSEKNKVEAKLRSTEKRVSDLQSKYDRVIMKKKKGHVDDEIVVAKSDATDTMSCHNASTEEISRAIEKMDAFPAHLEQRIRESLLSAEENIRKGTEIDMRALRGVMGSIWQCIVSTAGEMDIVVRDLTGCENEDSLTGEACREFFSEIVERWRSLKDVNKELRSVKGSQDRELDSLRKRLMNLFEDLSQQK